LYGRSDAINSGEKDSDANDAYEREILTTVAVGRPHHKHERREEQ
jgi:hypothetical protein